MSQPYEMAGADPLEGGITINPANPSRVGAPVRPEREPASQGARAPLPAKRVGVGEAIRWHWLTFAIPVVLFTTLAGAVGLLRTPDYTAEAKLAISESAGGPAGVSGFAANSQALAAGFSQAMDAPGVARQVSRKVGLPFEQVPSRVTASSTAGTPVIRIQATGATRVGAIRLANTASVALIGYLDRISRGGDGEQQLLNKFRDAAVQVNRLRGRVTALQKSRADSTTLNKARAARDAAELVAHTASTAYQTSQANRASLGDLQVLSPASGASSDRAQKLQLLILLGLAIGIATGAALASIRANR